MPDSTEKQHVNKGLERAATVVVYTLLVATMFFIFMGVYALANLVF